MNRHFPLATQDLFTIRDYVRFAVSRFHQANLFFGHGSSEAYDEAVYLVLHTLHLPLDRLEPFLDARLTESERSALIHILQRRVEERIPAAYLTKEAFLGEFSFYVDERVIVPRSFIAELLRDSLSPWVADPEAVHSVLDMCTGSGCLAILAAHMFPNAGVDAVDLSLDALDVAQHNVDDYELNDRVQLIESDLYAKLGNKKYDLIISNPPYVDAPSVADLPPEYLHEPELALGSGEDGLDATRTILKHAAKHLTDNGILIVEIGHNRDILESVYPKLPFTWLDVTAGDQFVFMLHRNDLSGL
ncbi:MAG: 50S ribosomal protein L3 N(5)-glutamine methyltransferase [Gallionella sp.]|nr:50S ribosomal protein L3 N(5)-glutamine methyltransferase [Gallionella sp.]